MDDVDYLFKAIVGWQPSEDGPLISVPLVRPLHLGHGPDLELIVRLLNNGLWYASPVQTKGGRHVDAIARYSSNKGNLPDGYNVIDLSTTRINGMPVAIATFQYKAGKTPEGQDGAVLEYTTRHFPNRSESGLVTLTSLYASQEVEGGRIDVHLNATTNEPKNHSMALKVVCSDKIYAELNFDSEGNLLRTSRAVFISPSHPLYEIHKRTSARDELVDPLITAIALIKGFPSQRPLHIEQLIQYYPAVYRPRLL
ncbi:MAG: hypothetical protein AABX63_06190 [Nanoarchaeota archaeon]